mgnify:CR=1 FL=1
MIGYLVRENVSRAGARNHRFDGGKIDYVCTGVHWLANGIIECYTRKLCEPLYGGSRKAAEADSLGNQTYSRLVVPNCL